jgi:nucleoside-diphosphate-sugar epimerase
MLNSIISKDIQAILSEKIGWGYLSGKTILVTGASGFIPSYIMYILIELNETKFKDNPMTIFALIRNEEKANKKFAQFISKKYFRLIVADVSQEIELHENINIIIHAASQASPKYYGADPVGTLKANTIGTANMLELAKKKSVEKFIFISSGEVYGVLDGSMNVIAESYTGNVDITNIRSCYAESKRMGENMCVCWSYQYGFHVNMLRLSHIYGPGVELEDGRVFSDFVRNVLNNEDIILNSDGKARRSFLYINDMITALFIVLFTGENGHAYNIAADQETEIRELAIMLCNLYPEKKLSMKFNEAVVPSGYIRSASAGAVFSTEKIKKLGWRQKISLEEGFRRMIESYAVLDCSSL